MHLSKPRAHYSIKNKSKKSKKKKINQKFRGYEGRMWTVTK